MLKNSQLIQLQKEIENIEDTLIIVEGTRDKGPLLRLGFKNVSDISGKSLPTFVESIKSKNYFNRLR